MFWNKCFQYNTSSRNWIINEWKCSNIIHSTYLYASFIYGLDMVALTHAHRPSPTTTTSPARSTRSHSSGNVGAIRTYRKQTKSLYREIVCNIFYWSHITPFINSTSWLKSMSYGKYLTIAWRHLTLPIGVGRHREAVQPRYGQQHHFLIVKPHSCITSLSRSAQGGLADSYL